MIRNIFYITGITAFLLLSLFLLSQFKKGSGIIDEITPTIFPSANPTEILAPTIPSDSGCCPLDKKLKGWWCARKTCVGIPYPDEGQKVEQCFPPDVKNPDLCPLKCLSSSTNIDTEKGALNVKDLKLGMLVWTVNKEGKKELQPIVKLSSVKVGKNHQIIHLVLDNGRELYVSPNHPTTDGRLVKDLKIGENYNDSIIQIIELVPYNDIKTYDLLPAGDTGFYFTNGILMGSTLKGP